MKALIGCSLALMLNHAWADLDNDAGGPPVQDVLLQQAKDKKEAPKAMVVASGGFSAISYDGDNEERLRELKNNGGADRWNGGFQGAYLKPIEGGKYWLGPSLALFPDWISNGTQTTNAFHWGLLLSGIHPLADDPRKGIVARVDLGLTALNTAASSAPGTPEIRFQGGLGVGGQMGLTWFLPSGTELAIGPGVSYAYFHYAGDSFARMGFFKIDFAFLPK